MPLEEEGSKLDGNSLSCMDMASGVASYYVMKDVRRSADVVPSKGEDLDSSMPLGY